MKSNDRAFFALNSEPVGSDLAPKEIMQTAEVLGVAKRFEYTIRLGALALVTEDVSSGKSTALRWTASRPYPSEYQIIWVTAPIGLHPETLQANLHRQLFQGRLHQVHQKTGPGDRPGPQKETRPHYR
ncbi:hypothetical protein DFAR_950034 [Desulfarculales bacterium]